MSWIHAAAFSAEPLYLNTASMGLPPKATTDALTREIAGWSAGRRQANDYDATVTRSRQLYAELVHVPAAWVAIGNQVSPLVGLIAASVPDGAEVLFAENDFTSVSFPFAAHADRGLRLREVPVHTLAEEIGSDTAWVVVSAVQSSTGTLADLDAIEAAAKKHGARTLIDLTQSAGWNDVDASRFDATVCAAYKWLLCPRGTAFLTLDPELHDSIRPLAANWYAGEDPWSSIYGLPLRLAADARRFDVSPAWQAWVGTEASLEFLLGVGAPQLEAHALEVSAAFASAAGLPDARSAILALAPVEGAAQQIKDTLERLDVMAANRAGNLRLSFHAHNTADEVEPLGAALRGLVHIVSGR
ncbi:aminotransferase class V-fold PLP-dependent enzyme [Pseudoclavibacter sp. VKM Ac-2888]|uniref:aminotransferase class V-fold PLP-dependent enzyme n=1 Tax=Pseudoclavibacter sp. VKM Ac-2888 TaxID=2783830 RepID=UPI00188CAAAC|nr:aminotransferase class V-fold PLP-dependent enzyme [Pseudoclavibacter sp. VKM Ac-2888]MBF4550598.1 aminotransferase class V-fold PLP-dependent enzyme [Pseudoclavibacter sp. VKM Ac-2888]